MDVSDSGIAFSQIRHFSVLPFSCLPFSCRIPADRKMADRKMVERSIIAHTNKPVVYSMLFHLKITVCKKPYPTQLVECPQPMEKMKEKIMKHRSRIALLSLVLIAGIGVAPA